jgi:predicted double-glycine peptidase
MTVESLAWFAGQAAAGGLAWLTGRRIGRARPAVWKATAAGATLIALGWPLLRVFPTAALRLLGAPVMVFTELTGVVIPAVLAFTIAAAHVPHPRDRRALRMLLVVCVLYFVRSGLWMVRPATGDWRSSRYADGVCRQATEYTCVAASLATVLGAHDIAATEAEMARLSYTEVNRGTTDTRAVLALERKLAGRPVRVQYRRLNYDELRQVPLPCLVPLKWGYFISHMVPLLTISSERVAIGDPLGGPRVLSRVEFEREWLGRAIYVDGLNGAE